MFSSQLCHTETDEKSNRPIGTLHFTHVTQISQSECIDLPTLHQLTNQRADWWEQVEIAMDYSVAYF